MLPQVKSCKKSIISSDIQCRFNKSWITIFPILELNSALLHLTLFITDYCKMTLKYELAFRELKDIEKAIDLELAGIICIATEKVVSLSDARLYLKSNYPEIKVNWREISIEKLNQIAEEAVKFAENRKIQNMTQIFYGSQTKTEIENNKTNQVSIEERIEQLQKKIQYQNVILHKASDQSQHHQIATSIKDMENQLIQLKSRKSVNLPQVQLPNDKEESALIDQIIDQLKTNRSMHFTKILQIQKSNLLKELQKFEKKRAVILHRLEQIFLHYCKQNYQSGLTFQDNIKNTQMLDLRLFLKYYKEFQIHEYKNQKYKITKTLVIFKECSLNGLWLDLHRFNELHFKLVGYDSTSEYSKREIVQADFDRIQELKQKIKHNTSKLRQIYDILNAKKMQKNLRLNFGTNEGLNFIQPFYYEIKQTQILSDQRKSNANFDSQSSRIIQTSSSKKSLDLKFQSKKSFISQVRQQIMNGEQSPNLSLKKRSGSLNDLTKQKVSHSVQLPRIIKLAPQQINHKGIYASLKRITPAQSKLQQEKLQLMLNSGGNVEDHQFLKAYLQKQQEIRAKSIQETKQKRKVMKSQFEQKKCVKLASIQSKPFMRFS